MDIEQIIISEAKRQKERLVSQVDKRTEKLIDQVKQAMGELPASGLMGLKEEGLVWISKRAAIENVGDPSYTGFRILLNSDIILDTMPHYDHPEHLKLNPGMYKFILIAIPQEPGEVDKLGNVRSIKDDYGNTVTRII